jgi:hypothetical protein
MDEPRICGRGFARWVFKNGINRQRRSIGERPIAVVRLRLQGLPEVTVITDPRHYRLRGDAALPAEEHRPHGILQGIPGLLDGLSVAF